MEIKDSGLRRNFESGAVRDVNEDKGDYSLLPTRATRRLAQIFQRGAKKYNKSNYKLGINYSVFIDSAKRHLDKYLEGWTDEPHLDQAAWNIMALLETESMVNEGLLKSSLNDLYEIQTGKQKDSSWSEASQNLNKKAEKCGFDLNNNKYLDQPSEFERFAAIDKEIEERGLNENLNNYDELRGLDLTGLKNHPIWKVIEPILSAPTSWDGNKVAYGTKHVLPPKKEVLRCVSNGGELKQAIYEDGKDKEVFDM